MVANKIVRQVVACGLALWTWQSPNLVLAQSSGEPPETPIPKAEPPALATQSPIAVDKEPRLPWLSNGITGGLALSFQLGKPLYLGSGRQDSIETTAVLFFQFNPMFWFQRERGHQCLKEPARLGWMPCLPHRLGLVLGRPLAYEASTSIPQEPVLTSVRTVRPQAALGLSYSITPEFSLMSGWMFARVTRQDGSEVKLGTLWLAFGGTVDLLR